MTEDWTKNRKPEPCHNTRNIIGLIQDLKDGKLDDFGVISLEHSFRELLERIKELGETTKRQQQKITDLEDLLNRCMEQSTNRSKQIQELEAQLIPTPPINKEGFE